MKKPETKNCIEIEGVFLTEKAIQELSDLQEQNNLGLMQHIDLVKDVICWIVSIVNELNEEDAKEAYDLMSGLNYLNKSLPNLRKP